METVNGIMLFPILGGNIFIRWEIAVKVYEGYVGEYGTIQTLKRIEERGGFGISEVNHYLGDASPFKSEE